MLLTGILLSALGIHLVNMVLTAGCSDFALFWIFKIGHIAVDQIYARRSFHIQKITGALKSNILG